ncbi:RNA recognition motif domain-containing protein [Pedobacter hartonius]|uniref:Splicing factor 1 n=1 Tax=Pedobacter hartonius TaxID=425514 RepID=A0A1H4BCD6_9SPHI|nr:RNA-binding protein [Pedobacter hartonius]SEA45791.1 splicing factor 1 [Pedobacter hartonius]
MVKLFIGGFPLNISELELVQLVSLHGTVSTVKIVRDKKTGICKGYAFLEMKSMTDAVNAVAALNGRVIDGQALSLKINKETVAPAATKAKPAQIPSPNPKYVKIEGPSAIVKKKRPRKS